MTLIYSNIYLHKLLLSHLRPHEDMSSESKSESESESDMDVIYVRWWVELGIRAYLNKEFKDMDDCPSMDSFRRLVTIGAYSDEETGEMITIVDAREWVENAIQKCVTGVCTGMDDCPDPGFIDEFRPKKTVFSAHLALFIKSAYDEAEAKLREIDIKHDQVESNLRKIEVERLKAEANLRKIEVERLEAKANLEDIKKHATMFKAASA